MEMARIDVISSCLVGMANKCLPISNSKMDLSPLDLRLLQIGPCQRVILFNKPSECNQGFETTIIHHLKTSLSRTLDFFPPLSGRLGTVQNTDKTSAYFIDCNNAGAQFVHAIARNISMSNILEPTYTPNITSTFLPLNGYLNYEGVSKPLLGVQVTELVDGFLIGVTANHAIVDGASFWHFINSWSEISRGLDTISRNPCFERWIPSNITNDNRLIYLPPFEKNPWHSFNVTTPPLLQRIFHFSKENLVKLKLKANLEAGTEKISTLQALSAHVWRSVVRQQHNKISNINNQLQEVYYNFMMLVDTRARIPLPDGYFGNAVYGARAACTAHEVLNHGLGYVALKLNELVNQQTKETAIKFVEDCAKGPMSINKGINTLLMTSSPRYDIYGNDFGWGEPIGVRGGHPFDGKIAALPGTRTGGGGGSGVDLEVCLAPITLQAMEDDAEFMEAVTI